MEDGERIRLLPCCLDFYSFASGLHKYTVAKEHGACSYKLTIDVLKNLAQRQLRRVWVNKRVAAIFQIALLLFVLAMTCSERLHDAFHPDSSNPNHQCVVTTVRSGPAAAPSFGMEIVCAETPPTTLAIFVVSVPVADSDYSLPPSCGPPALLS